MKKLDSSKFTTIQVADMSDEYEREYIALLKERNMLSIQNTKLQKVLQEIADKNIDAIPEEYLMEDEENGTDNR